MLLGLVVLSSFSFLLLIHLCLYINPVNRVLYVFLWFIKMELYNWMDLQRAIRR
jgi:hypothetical protein